MTRDGLDTHRDKNKEEETVKKKESDTSIGSLKVKRKSEKWKRT